MVPLLILLLALVLIVLPIWALIKILSLQSSNERLEHRIRMLERSVEQQANLQRIAAHAAPPVEPPVVPPVEPMPVAVPAAPPAPPIVPATTAVQPEPPAARPPVPDMPPVTPPPVISTPAFSPNPPPVVATRTAAAAARPRFNWEQFTGAKLLAWTGGAAAFLGAAFFIKYSFEHDLISPAMRVAIGYVFALALVVVGLRMPRPRYAPTAQTLVATGIVCLYAVTFACSSIYEFPFFTPLRTFMLMALITAAAFILAIRLGAQVVAILGMLGGFLTPVLLSTGRNNPFGLFGYIALLDVGLVALALHQRWFFLVPLGAAGTVVMQAGWAAKFLSAAKAPTAMVVCLVFCLIFLAAFLVAQRLRRPSPALLWPAIALPCVAFLFALGFTAYPTIASQPRLLFSFIFAADACLLAIAWLDDDSPHLHLLGGFAVFALLALWTGAHLTNAMLPWGLGLYLLHGVVHTSFPLLLERQRPGISSTWLSQAFPPLALVLMVVTLLKLETASLALWPCVLLVDVLAIGLAAFSGSLIAVGTALVLTFLAATVWLFRGLGGDETPLLLVIGGFAGLFFAAGLFIGRRLPEAADGHVGNRQAQLPAFSALMPFLLLVMMTQRLPMANPSGVFALALLLVLLCLGLTVLLSGPLKGSSKTTTAAGGREAGSATVGWLPLCALAGAAALEYAWDARHVTRSFSGPPFSWYTLFYLVFAVFPFVFRARFAAFTGPWAVAALVGPVQYPLIHWIVDRAVQSEVMGIVPALFAVAPLLSMFVIYRAPTADERARLNQLAWFGGVGLFFVTLIVPVQFERQWITLGWAIEGAALLWLFRRVPHPGLRATGMVLLVIAFVRLALNPAVLEYHARSGAPIFNWYLYTYGTVTLCLFVAGSLLPPGQDRALGVRVRPLLISLGVILAFLLLNIEIADFFSPPGGRVLTFQFSGHFGRDMTYTIAWALFALTLLLLSIWKRTAAGRYAALALLGVAVLKLFFHDLERLGALHRIGALFAVAIIAIVASLAYQRFLPGDEKSEPKP